MPRLILFNKPFQVLSQFTGDEDHRGLIDYFSDPLYRGFYPAGRLDFDSEGLLLLTDDGGLQHRIAHPSHKLPKTYWVQVEGKASPDQLRQLAAGVTLNDGATKPAKAVAIPPPSLWPRNPPVRVPQRVPTDWIEVTLTEGRNRQVRRMTAAVGLPTLRLIRVRIGPWALGDLQPGEMRWETVNLPQSTAPGARGAATTKGKRNELAPPRNRRDRR